MALTTLNPKVDQQNLIINPCMRYWRRDTSFDSSYAYQAFVRGYTADRWCVPSGFSGTTVVSRQSLNSSDPMVSETPQSRYYLRYAGASLYNTIDRVSQGIEVEDHNFFEQKWMTLSFWAKTDTGNPTMWWALRRFFDEDDWTNGGYDLAATNSFQLTTSWQKFTFTFQTSSVTASPTQIKYPNLRLDFIKRIAGADATGYSITPFDSSSFNLDITNIKLEFGTQATPLVYNKDIDLLNCCRWFASSLGTESPLGTQSHSLNFMNIYNTPNDVDNVNSFIFVPPRLNNSSVIHTKAPANSRLRVWSINSSTIDRIYARDDATIRIIDNYTLRVSGSILVRITGGAVSNWFYGTAAICFEYWY